MRFWVRSVSLRSVLAKIFVTYRQVALTSGLAPHVVTVNIADGEEQLLMIDDIGHIILFSSLSADNVGFRFTSDNFCNNFFDLRLLTHDTVNFFETLLISFKLF